MRLTFEDAEFMAMLLDMEIKFSETLVNKPVGDIIAVRDFLGQSTPEMEKIPNAMIKEMQRGLLEQCKKLRERIRETYGI